MFMPVPIIPQNVDSLMRKEREMQVQKVDYNAMNLDNLSLLFTERKNLQEIIKVGTFEAGLLFRLWKDSSATSDDIDVPHSFTNDDIIRLKASGLLTGNTEKVKMTPRGKEVIKTMVLTEKNALDKSAKDKTYEVRQAETKGVGKPRLAVGKKK
jgi:hypothetical protein